MLNYIFTTYFEFFEIRQSIDSTENTEIAWCYFKQLSTNCELLKDCKLSNSSVNTFRWKSENALELLDNILVSINAWKNTTVNKAKSFYPIGFWKPFQRLNPFLYSCIAPWELNWIYIRVHKWRAIEPVEILVKDFILFRLHRNYLFNGLKLNLLFIRRYYSFCYRN